MFEKQYEKILKMNNNDNEVKIIKNILEGGKLARYNLFKEILGDIDDENVGFCIELLQAIYLVIDDIMDGSEFRRRKKCFYKVRGLKALRDCNRVFSILFKLLPKKEYNLFADIHFITVLGQNFDLLGGIGKIKHTMRYYSIITSYKNGIYSFYLPIVAALLLKNQPIPENLYNLCEIAGFVSQMNDDLMNFMPFFSGKSGTDIEEKKMTWFSVQILTGPEKLRKEFYAGKGKLLSKELLKLIKAFSDNEKEILRQLYSKSEKETDFYLRKIMRILGQD